MSIMIDSLNPPAGPMTIMDRGIATAEVLDMLVERGFRFFVVNTESRRTTYRCLQKRYGEHTFACQKWRAHSCV
jgi:hypothetical protein